MNTRYEFHVAEPMSATALSAFPELTIADTPTRTVLYGCVLDRSEFHSILDRFQLMGLTLLDVHRLPD